MDQAHPNDAQAHALLGSLEEAQGDKEKATAYYKKALQIQPEQPVAANNLAYLMVESGQNIDVALSLAQTARRAMPNSATRARHPRLGLLPERHLRFGARSAGRSRQDRPSNASIHYHLGMTYSKLSDK